MSAVKAKNVKVQNSAGTAEATLSFDGVDIVSDKPIAAPAAVGGNDLVNFSQVIGIGQTWQDVTASRALGVTYTNTTGKPIYVLIRHSGVSGNASQVSPDGITWMVVTNSSSGGGINGSFIVPDGWRYKSANIVSWMELR
jgi:hypothetical protein